MFVQKLNNALEQIFQAHAYEWRNQTPEAYALYWSIPSDYVVTFKQDIGVDIEAVVQLDMYFDYQDGDIGPYGYLTAKLNDYNARDRKDKAFKLTQVSRAESIVENGQTLTCVSTNATLQIHIDYNTATEVIKEIDLKVINTEC